MKSIEYYEHPIHENTPEWFIFKDDPKCFLTYANLNNINISLGELIINNIYFSFMDFACYCPSLKTFKFLFLNGVKVTSNSILRTVQGGSEEIIHFLVGRNYSFNDKLSLAVAAHRNEVAKWLYENYHERTFALPCCVQYFNTEMFLFFYSQGFDLGEPSQHFQRTVLHYAAYVNHTILTKFLFFMQIQKK